MEYYFSPYVGKTYYAASTKILVLGDSHYCEEECAMREHCGIRGMNLLEMGECRNKTHEIMNKYLSGEHSKSHSTFDKILSGNRNIEPYQRLELWDSLAFYNFVQTAAHSKADGKYKSDDYKQSVKYVWSAIEELQPDLVIVWGDKAYDALPPDGWSEIKRYESGYYTLENGHIVKVVKIHHPSRGVSIEKNHQRIVDILNHTI